MTKTGNRSLSLTLQATGTMLVMPLKNRFPLAIMLSALLFAGQAVGHGDNEAPLHVAPDGTDSGDCLDATQPCATIAYALGRTGKGGSIRVAEGTYRITNAEDIFHLVSGAVEITGGHRPGGSSDRGMSVLAGVPYEHRAALEARGFRVIADQKVVDETVAASADKLISLHDRLKSSIQATPCTSGSAAGLPCDSVDLLSHVGLQDVSGQPPAGNDIWGFVDLNTGREYAIVGFSLGTAVFDVSDATNPREVGFIDGQSAVWRDIKVYQYFDATAGRFNAYAYVTTDGSTDGLFVIDLTGLPHSIRRVSYASDIMSAHNVYATNTDYSTGLSVTGEIPTLIVAGSNLGSGASRGRFRNYSLADPTAPSFISGGTGTGYMHDAASIIITDSRKDTQCVNAGEYCEVLLDFNENQIELWDITIPTSPVLLNTGGTSYSNVRYVHSGWWSEDRMTVFVHDELDERDRGLQTTLRAFSVADLRNPVLQGTWSGPTPAIDHNGFVRGNRYYMSNYTRGLTVLDITDPAAPQAVGHLDTYPGSDSTMFNGAWGAYPYFHSGNVAISDIDSGFYMAADRTRDTVAGALMFSEASFAADEGQQALVVVERAGGNSGAVDVGWEALHASSSEDDYSSATGRLSWPAGDSTSRTITVDVTNDGIGEPAERLIVRLVDPRGGATLGDRSTASVYFSDPGAASSVEFSTPSVTVTERGFATVVGVLRRTGSAVGPVSVDLSVAGTASAGEDYTGSIPARLTWADGDGDPKLYEITLIDDLLAEGDESLDVSLSNPVGAVLGANTSFRATILDGAGANSAPNALAGAGQTRPAGSLVTLDGSQSSDPDGDALTYQWSQTMGPNVDIAGSSMATASFSTPSVSSDTMLRFQLTVTDAGGLSDTDATVVTVTTSADTSPGGGGGFGLGTLIALLAALRLRRIRRTGRS